jgi:hypothetical protein
MAGRQTGAGAGWKTEKGEYVDFEADDILMIGISDSDGSEHISLSSLAFLRNSFVATI